MEWWIAAGPGRRGRGSATDDYAPPMADTPMTPVLLGRRAAR
jgi:hypothetical protein